MLNQLDSLFAQEVQDLYSAETQVSEALPKMMDAVTNPELRSAFETYVAGAKARIEHLSQICSTLGVDPKGNHCQAAQGLIAEAQDVAGQSGDASVKDAAMIGRVQAFTHYQIANYGTARTHAAKLAMADVSEMLQSALEQEKATDDQLAKLAESGINQAAASQA